MADTIISQFERTYSAPIEVYRQVASAAARNNIPTGVRWEGMQVYVVADSTTYELRGGIGNEDWINTADLVSVAVEDDLISNITTNALSANQGRVLNEKFADYLKLDGTVEMSGTLTINGGGVVADGSVTCLSLIETSDVRLKENITTLAQKPVPIRAHWVSYNYKKDKEKRTRYGVIAQDLEQYHPELVVTAEDGTKAVHYTALHSAKIAELERRLEVLERKIDKGPPRHGTRIIGGGR